LPPWYSSLAADPVNLTFVASNQQDSPPKDAQTPSFQQSLGLSETK